METETEERLEKKIDATHKLAKENHEMLLGMKRAQMWASIMRVVYWLIILGAAGAAYLFIQPYVQVVGDAYRDIKDSVNQVKSVGEKVTNFGGIFKKDEGEEQP